MDDYECTIIPDTPSPVFKSKQQRSNKMSDNPFDVRANKPVGVIDITNSPHSFTSPGDFSAGLDIQTNKNNDDAKGCMISRHKKYGREKVEHYLKKRRKEKLSISPIKPVTDISGTGDFDNHGSSSNVQRLTSVDHQGNSPNEASSSTASYSGFVKSSSMISPSKLATYTSSHISSGASGFSSLDLCDTNTPGNMADKYKPSRSKDRNRVKNNHLYWPSSSSDSSDDEQLFKGLTSKTLKNKLTKPKAQRKIAKSKTSVRNSAFHKLPHSNSDSILSSNHTGGLSVPANDLGPNSAYTSLFTAAKDEHPISGIEQSGNIQTNGLNQHVSSALQPVQPFFSRFLSVDGADNSSHRSGSPMDTSEPGPMPTNFWTSKDRNFGISARNGTTEPLTWLNSAAPSVPSQSDNSLSHSISSSFSTATSRDSSSFALSPSYTGVNFNDFSVTRVSGTGSEDGLSFAGAFSPVRSHGNRPQKRDSPLGSRDNPISVDSFEHVTPQTKRAVQQIQQVQSDEEMARKLQEEMDREFAMSLDSGNVANAPTWRPPPERPTRGRARGGRHARHGDPEGQDFLSMLLQQSAADLELDLAALAQPRGRARRARGGRVGFEFLVGSPVGGNDYETLLNLAESIGDAKEKGLSKTEAHRLPTVTYARKEGEKEEECNICMCSYEDGDTQKVLPCFHNFHAACIDKWILKNATCPICRVPVKIG